MASSILNRLLTDLMTSQGSESRNSLVKTCGMSSSGIFSPTVVAGSSSERRSSRLTNFLLSGGGRHFRRSSRLTRPGPLSGRRDWRAVVRTPASSSHLRYSSQFCGSW